jgi:hypothetical protein
MGTIRGRSAVAFSCPRVHHVPACHIAAKDNPQWVDLSAVFLPFCYRIPAISCDATTDLKTPPISGGQRPSLMVERGVEVGLAHRAAWLGGW